MRRTPLQQLGDVVGMYAYLAALGGMRYWPEVRRAGIDGQPLPAEITAPSRDAEALTETAAYEFELGRERIPV